MKIGIIGMGWVGSSVAISTLHAGVATELLLHDVREGLAEGEAMDMAHGAPFYPSASVRAVDSLAPMRDADAVVIAAGRGGAPGESRLALLEHTAGIARTIGEQLRGMRGLIVVVSNPVDVLVRVVTEASGLPPERVIGTGTMLDTARLRRMLGEELGLSSRSIHANVVGEHGDSSVLLLDDASIGGVPLRTWPGWDRDREPALVHRVRHAAHEIIARKGATNHAIGLVTASLLRWMLRGDRRVITVSRMQTGALGLDGLALSLPTVVGRDGATRILEPTMDDAEREALARSAEVLREAYDAIGRQPV
ncbi:MAG: L-lactate dehydrogenase [Myxococcales bacterium]|nr:L-lactate dehydrogenase [Myxococcales bacterium]